MFFLTPISTQMLSGNMPTMDEPMKQRQQSQAQMAQQQPQPQPRQQPQSQLTIEQDVSKHLRDLNKGFAVFKKTSKLGVRKCPYTTPTKPSAGAVDKKRLLLDSKLQKVHKTVEQGRALVVQLHREVEDVQETQYCFQQLKARRLEFVALETAGIKERADKAAEAQERAQATLASNKPTMSQLRAAAAADDDGADAFDWDSSQPEDVDLA